MTDSQTSSSTRLRQLPVPLVAVVVLTSIEVVASVMQGLALVPAVEGDRVAMGVTSVVFFLIYGAFLAVCAWQLSERRSWARAPVVLAQLLQILVGFSFWGDGTTWVAVALIVLGTATLAAIFHPESLAALESQD